MQNFPWFSQSLAIAFSLAKLPSFRHLPIMSPKMKDQIKLKISLIIISPRTHERLSTVFMKLLQPLNDEAACTFCTIGVEKHT